MEPTCVKFFHLHENSFKDYFEQKLMLNVHMWDYLYADVHWDPWIKGAGHDIWKFGHLTQYFEDVDSWNGSIHQSGPNESWRNRTVYQFFWTRMFFIYFSTIDWMIFLRGVNELVQARLMIQHAQHGPDLSTTRSLIKLEMWIQTEYWCTRGLVGPNVWFKHVCWIKIGQIETSFDVD